MIYHVVILGPDTKANDRTDLTTRSFYEAAYRRNQLHKRGYPVEVHTGAGRLVVDTAGTERR